MRILDEPRVAKATEELADPVAKHIGAVARNRRAAGRVFHNNGSTVGAGVEVCDRERRLQPVVELVHGASGQDLHHVDVAPLVVDGMVQSIAPAVDGLREALPRPAAFRVLLTCVDPARQRIHGVRRIRDSVIAGHKAVQHGRPGEGQLGELRSCEAVIVWVVCILQQV